MKTLFVVLPAFNESQVIREVLRKLKQELKKIKEFQSYVVVVDDGSSDKTSREAARGGSIVLRHVLNRGLGGALETGLTYAKRKNADILVTMDSDGQHDAKDIWPALQPILADQADVVIGSRQKGKRPLDRHLINLMSNVVTWLLFGIWSSDSQSGFRVFNHKAIRSIKIMTQEMEVSSEIFGEIKRNHLRFCEVPIRVIYTEYSRRKGQQNLNGPRVLLKLIIRLFRS